MELLENILVYAILGAIQGLSEPIPISSSGHLVIFKSIFTHLGWTFPSTDITFEVLVNTGSLLAIMFYYRKDLIRLITSFFTYICVPSQRDNKIRDFRYCMLLIVATIPAAIGGVLFNDYIEVAFSNVKLVGCTLLITSCFLMLIHKKGYNGKRHKKNLNLWDALRMGAFQLIALLPGISRSGATITGGILGDLDQKTARDFSFFMFMPVSFGAIILKIGDFMASSTLATLWLPYLISFIVSAIVTYIALHILFRILNKGKMNYFSIYCFVMGLISLILL
ncbi:MAG: undecaprenyl-diphosphate phosphatase [Erysipelotrichaceae bacterium]|nr:undecaprenyl-diphosphate phosphatase [Erysipelotrichaceae bacterium]